jgi:hypothetical protein
MSQSLSLLGYETLQEEYFKYGCKTLVFHNPGFPGTAFISITALADNSIDVIIKEDDGDICCGVAYGNIKLVSGEYFVNGVKNGLLHDKYKDNFNMTADKYSHFLKFSAN